MGVPVAASGLVELNELVSVTREKYAQCIDVVDHSETIDGIDVTTRMHHLKFDGNGTPMIESLAECLYLQIIHYCLAARNRPESLTPEDATRLTKEARKLFIHPPATPDDPDQTGEAGEILLYFLIEAVLGAPQVVCKMDLKTNRRDEVKGSDGIHMQWCDDDECVDVYFGEAKLFQDVGSAMTKAIESIDSFYANDMRRHEFKMVTKHFKYSGADVREAVTHLLANGVPNERTRVKHACLIGYNWNEFGSLPKLSAAQLTAEFKRRYQSDAPRLHGLLQKRFDGFGRNELIFELFFLPFPKVQDLRDAFNKALD